MNGNPTLDMLGFVLEYEDCEIGSKEKFLTYITEIHQGMLETLRTK